MSSISSTLAKHGIKAVSKRNDTLFNYIRTDIEKREKLQEPGIYRIPLHREINGKVERACYIGRTLRQIKERLNEHMNNVKNKDITTALTEAVVHEGWKPDWSETAVLDKPRNLLRSIILEYIHINKSDIPLINEQTKMEHLDIWLRANNIPVKHNQT